MGGRANNTGLDTSAAPAYGVNENASPFKGLVASKLVKTQWCWESKKNADPNQPLTLMKIFTVMPYTS